MSTLVSKSVASWQQVEAVIASPVPTVKYQSPGDDTGQKHGTDKSRVALMVEPIVMEESCCSGLGALKITQLYYYRVGN
jgi:hypothetical protein